MIGNSHNYPKNYSLHPSSPETIGVTNSAQVKITCANVTSLPMYGIVRNHHLVLMPVNTLYSITLQSLVIFIVE